LDFNGAYNFSKKEKLPYVEVGKIINFEIVKNKNKKKGRDNTQTKQTKIFFITEDHPRS
jgi:hypothetical protein